MERGKRRAQHLFGRSIASGAVIIAILIIAGCATVNTDSTMIDGSSSQSGSTSMITQSVVFDQHVRMIQEGAEPKPAAAKLTPQEATKRNGIKVKLPKETFGGVLRGVYVDVSASGNPSTSIIFGSGFAIDEEIIKEKPDYQAQVIAGAASKQDASTYIGGDNHIVTVDGQEGMASSSYSFVGLDKKEYKMPPQLCWWDNGVQYLITCWKLGLTEQQLISIAESMSN